MAHSRSRGTVHRIELVWVNVCVTYQKVKSKGLQHQSAEAIGAS